MKRRILSVFLALVMLVSLFPSTGYATNEGSTTEVDTGDVSIEGTNGFGELLSAELMKNQAGSMQDLSENENGYTVTGLEIDGNMATVEYYSLETAVLMVAIYSEDWMQLLASGQVVIDPEENQTVVTIEGEMPEYFQASAFLMDTYDLSPLCVAYTTPLYTQAMQELLNSTIHDYDEERVLNLDEDETTNFAVYAEDTIVIENRLGMNTIVSADDETVTYVIANADTSITGLQIGDVFVYQYGEDELLIVKVAEISVNGTTVTITGDDTLEMGEVFETVKIEGESDTSDIIVDDSTADEGVTYLGMKSDGDVATYATDGGISSRKKLEYELEVKGKAPTGEDVTATSSVLLELTTELRYYFAWNTKYVKFQFTNTVDYGLEFKGTIEHYKKKMGDLSVPIPSCPFVTIGFEPELIIELSGSIKGNLELTMTIGFCYDDLGMRNISNGPKIERNYEVGGELYFKIDFSPQIAIEPLKCEIASMELTAEAGIKITATLINQNNEPNATIHHECLHCLDLALSAVMEIGVKLELLDVEDRSIILPAIELEIPLLKAYYSLSNDKFGVGTCPNITYRVTIELKDASKRPVANWDITVSTLNKQLTTNENGVAVYYAPSGTLKFEARKDGYYGVAQKNVQSAAKIVLTMSVDEQGNDQGDDGFNPGGIIGDIDPGEIVDPGVPDEPGTPSEPGTPVNSGICGDNVTWTLHSNGMLQISGSGKMYDYSYSSNVPWYKIRKKITSVTIDAGVTSIGSRAFYDCDGLTGIVIPEGVTSIGSDAFWDCGALQSVYIPSTLETVAQYGVFDYCNKLTDVTFGEGITKLPAHLFYNCDGLQSITLPETLTEIPANLFYDCDRLTSIVIPEGVTSIGSDAFWDCGALQSVYIPSTLETVAQYGVFDYCNKLTDVTFGEGITKLPAHLFYNCDGLQSITLPETLTEISVCLFSDCDGLTGIVIPEGVTSIGKDAFWDCGALQSVYIPSTLETVAQYGVFGLCNKLTDVTFGEGITKLPAHLFYNCDGLVSVTIPSSVTAIGSYAFYDCDGLTDVYYAGTEEQWNAISIGVYNEDLLNANIHYNSTNTARAVDETVDEMQTSQIVVSNDTYAIADDAELLTADVSGEDAQPAAVYPGDYSTEVTDNYTLKTASFAGLVPGQQYILLALKSLDAENLLSADNLLYINQAEALEDGTLIFRYIQSESVGVSYVMACGASNKNLSDAQITFTEMTASDTLQTIDPTVVYDGETLTEGKDYVITGVVDYTEAGEYICYIRGIYKYTGLVECHYTVQSGTSEDPDDPALDVLMGDVTGDGKVNVGDAVKLLKAIASKTTGEFSDEVFKAADVTRDGKINVGDAVKLLKAIASKTTDEL